MKIFKTTIRLGILLGLGIMWTMMVYAQEPQGDPAGDLATQGEIGPTGLAEGPSGSDEVYYMFTGVYNKELADPKFATVVHCTNIGPSSASVTVQFFDRNSGIPAIGNVTIPPSHTRSVSTQAVSGFNVTVANTFGTDIKHGSGWVLAPADKELICVVEVVSLDNGGTPIGSVDLPVFDENGDCASPDCINLGDDGGIFLPIILKNSLFF